MLGTRILLGVPSFFGIFFVLWLDVWFGTGWFLAGLQAVFCTLALREFYRLARAQGHAPFVGFGLVMCVLLFFGQERMQMTLWHGAPPFLGAGLNLLFVLVMVAVLGTGVLQIVLRGTERTMTTLASTLLGLIYCWFLLSFPLMLRHLSVPGGHGWAYDGMEFVFLLVCVGKISDVGGLLVGSRFGQHKLCPAISPKKTWEGAIGGVCASVALMSLFLVFEPDCTMARIGWARALILAVLLAMSSLTGDLLESAFKRDSCVKDAGDSLPGFGGFLDVLDSLTIAGPMMYIYMIVVCGAQAG